MKKEQKLKYVPPTIERVVVKVAPLAGSTQGVSLPPNAGVKGWDDGNGTENVIDADNNTGGATNDVTFLF